MLELGGETAPQLRSSFGEGNYPTIIESCPRLGLMIALFVYAKRIRQGTATRTAQVKL